MTVHALKDGRQVTVRLKSAHDGPALGRMLEACSQQTYAYFHPYPLTFGAGLLVAGDERIHCLVAVTDDGEAAGYAWIKKEGDVPTLGICIGDAWQGLGVGTILMKSLIAEARALAKAGIALTVMQNNARAIALYRQVGFAIDGELEDHLGPAYHMTLMFDR